MITIHQEIIHGLIPLVYNLFLQMLDDRPSRFDEERCRLSLITPLLGFILRFRFSSL